LLRLFVFVLKEADGGNFRCGAPNGLMLLQLPDFWQVFDIFSKVVGKFFVIAACFLCGAMYILHCGIG